MADETKSVKQLHDEALKVVLQGIAKYADEQPASSALNQLSQAYERLAAHVPNAPRAKPRVGTLA